MNRPRVRKSAKWAGLVACALIAASLVLGLRWRFGRTTFWTTAGASGPRDHFRTVMVFRGALQWSRSDTEAHSIEPPGAEWFWLRANPGMRWWPAWGTGDAWMPLWIPLLLLASPTALLWRADRRRFGPGRCGKCGYDHRGLAPDAKCPECGEIPPSAEANS